MVVGANKSSMEIFKTFKDSYCRYLILCMGIVGTKLGLVGRLVKRFA